MNPGCLTYFIPKTKISRINLIVADDRCDVLGTCWTFKAGYWVSVGTNIALAKCGRHGIGNSQFVTASWVCHMEDHK
jgi:hypothetical protein